MYDSALTEWDAMDRGPRRDLVGELAEAARDAGLVFCLSNHRMEHWDFMHPTDDVASDIYDPAFAEFYGPPQPPTERPGPAFLEEWLMRNQELVDLYQPRMVFFDYGVNHRALDEIKLRFAAYYCNRTSEWGAEVTLTTKRDAYLVGTVKDYERGRAVNISSEFWQCDTSIAHNSWGTSMGSCTAIPVK